MGISLRNKRRRRRSYADYRPPGERRPRSDPFRIVLYLALIATGVWAYFNQDTVKTALSSRLAGQDAVDPLAGDASVTETAPAPQGDPFALAEAAYRDGDLMTAVQHYRAAAEQDPGNPAYHVQVARLLLFEASLHYGDQQAAMLEEALEAANMATLIDPFDPAGYAIEGKIYDWQGRPDQASAALLQALDLDPEYALAYSYLAEAYVDLDRWDQAQQTIQQALELQPDNVDVRRDYGYILEYLSFYEDAAIQYETALRLHPNLAYIRVALGRIYGVLGRYDEALEQLLLVEDSQPSSPMVAFEIGRVYESYIGEPDTALDYYRRVVDLDSDFGRAWLRIGTLYYFQGRYEEATIALERALSLNVDSPDIYYQLGLAYANDGKCGNALRYLNEAQARAEGDQRILDAALEGFQLCSQPTPTPLAATPQP